MAYTRPAHSGYSGHHLTTALLEANRPAAENAGCFATVGTVLDRADYYMSAGDGWVMIPGLAVNPLTGGVLLLGPDGMTMPGSVLGRSGIASSITDSPAQSTTESTLQTLVIPANTLGANDGIEISILYSCTNTAATKRIRGRFGGSVLWNLDLTTHLTFRQDFILRNRNSLSSQIAQAASTTIFSPIGSVGVQTFTLDFAAEQTLTLTGQFPVAGTSLNTLAVEQYSVKLI